MKKILLVLGLLLFPQLAEAQEKVFTLPYQAATLNSSSTITVTNIFQSIFAAVTTKTGRTACVIQNNGTHNMYIFFGPIVNATIASSVQLTSGQSVNCNNGPVVLNDQVSITGTAGDIFYAAQQ